MFKEKKHIIGIIILSIFIIFFLLKILLSNFVENKVTDALNNSKSDKYITSVEDVNFKLFDRSITFDNIFISPKPTFLSDSLSQNINNDTLEKITISSIKINDIRFFDYLFRNDINIGELEINDLIIQKSNRKKVDTVSKKPINLDSIHIDKINGLKIDKFNLNNIQFSIVDSITNKSVFYHKPVNLDLDGFQLKKVKDQQFKLMPINKNFKINNIEIGLTKKEYSLFIEEIDLNTETSSIQIINLKYKTLNGKYALAKKDIYNNVVPEFSIEKIELVKIDFTKLIQNEGLFIDNILISKAVIDLYKDRRKPYDKRLYKELPHLALKKMEYPLYIKQININNSLLLLEESFPNKNMNLKLSINEINATINNISTIDKFKENPIKAKLESKLMNKAKLVANFTFPMNTDQSTFYFDGNLGSTKFTYFDEVIYPVLGLKILEGNLDNLSFQAKANKYSSSGTMKMLYHDLNATVYKHDNPNEKSKVLSWAVKTVLHNSNPTKKKKARIAILSHKYEPEKGIGNYLWKILQSGIVNTLSPAGNKTSKKADELIYKKEHKKKKKPKR
ncbi:MAG: hypothetical protein KAH67_01545 [Flavobacteriaceae bacterium]|nr:hypothetical protein [Flavobacteriaceae bacterium]